MIKRILICFVLLSAMNCGATLHTQRQNFRNENRQKLLHLLLGMTKTEVLEVMDTNTVAFHWFGEVDQLTNPHRIEAFRDSLGTEYEILFYYTDLKEPDGAITDDELTPLVLKDNQLIGWGWSFVNENVLKYRIDIR